MRNATCHYCCQNGACETGTNNKHFYLVFPNTTTVLFVHRISLEVYRSVSSWSGGESTSTNWEQQRVDDRGRIHITQIGEAPVAAPSRAKSPSQPSAAKKGKGKAKAEDSDLESEDWVMDPVPEGSKAASSVLSELSDDEEGVVEGDRVVYYYEGDPQSLEQDEEDEYDSDGYDSYGFDKDGLDKDGYNEDGFDKDGFDRDGYDEEGHDQDGLSSPSSAEDDDRSSVNAAAQERALPQNVGRERSVEYDDLLAELDTLRAEKEAWKAEERKWGIYDTARQAENCSLRTELTRSNAANHTLIKRLQVSEATTQKLSQRINQLSKKRCPTPAMSELEEVSEEEGEGEDE